ncbi:MAG: outer membrane lipoprotein chaperone LolA [Pseudomonadota bacterium]
MIKRTLITSALCLWSFSALAGGSLDRLDAFLEETRTLSADFTQTLEDADGKQLEKQSGTVMLERPGHFVWHYKQPYEQVLVGDGDNLWHYDVDLEQVSVRPLDEALGTAPIALLTSETPLEEQFVLTELGKIEEHYMVQLEARVKDTDYGFALLAFLENGELDVMQLRDPMGQVTTIDLDEMEVNPELPGDAFEFTPPEGVDVVGEPVSHEP